MKNLDAKILVAISNGKPRLGVNYPPYLPSLEMSRWHACKTTHCRAGWAIALAGRRGYALERKRGPSVAGALIYHASTGRIPEFYASNEDALADIQKCAKEQ